MNPAGPLTVHCPFCRKALDGYEEATGKPVRPQVGDVLLCIYCGTVGRLSAEGALTAVPARVLRSWPTGATRREIAATLIAICELRLLELIWEGLRYGLYRRD